jgi:site-specific DNA-methyltransferase (adenine-specific)
MIRDGAIYEHTRIGTVDFLHADNMLFLKWAKENMLYKHFHVAIVDPPYGIGVTDMNMGTDKKMREALDAKYESGDWDDKIPTKEYFELLSYVARQEIIWGGNYFTEHLAWSGRSFVVWDKMLSYKAFSHAELALTTFDQNAVIVPYARGRLEKQDEGRRHRTQKPVYVYDYLHLTYVQKGWRILDTHGGSFSHAIAALKNGNHLVIMDIQRSYYEAGIQAAMETLKKPRIMF